ncbi:MAG: hypothetical protein M1324_04620 [Patescibacteria group bacterium]|nr:hypothetical protein [Patescibacteria group bacterium]
MEVMNCKELTQTINELNKRLMDIKDQISFADSEKIDILKQHLENLSGKIDEALANFEIRLSEEEIEENQYVYNWIGMESVDIKKEYKKHNILLPTKQEIEAAAKNGYAELLIIPGSSYAKEFYKEAKQSIKEKYTIIDEDSGTTMQRSEGIIDQQVDGFFDTSGSVESGEKYYALLLNPVKEISQIDPDLIGKSPREIIKEKNLKNNTSEYVNCPLVGLSLVEYVYFQLHSCLKYSGGLMPYHPDSESTSWLLQKRISLDVGGVYFKANWLERAGAIAVDWSRENISLPNTGARFAVLPKSVQKYLTGETPLDIKLSNGDKQ